MRRTSGLRRRIRRIYAGSGGGAALAIKRFPRNILRLIGAFEGFHWIASRNTPCAVLPSLPLRNSANKYGTMNKVVGVRSEERRVGKECRSRGSVGEEKKRAVGKKERESAW